MRLFKTRRNAAQPIACDGDRASVELPTCRTARLESLAYEGLLSSVADGEDDLA
jgi:hypothetical protein